MDNYEKRVRAYESKGCTRSDAQAVVDAEDMNKGRHTPGPWLVTGNQRNGHFDFVLPMANDDDFQANARLIAAAPELLEACNKMLAWFEAHYTDLMPIDTHFNKNSMLKKTRQTIAKAEGK